MNNLDSEEIEILEAFESDKLKRIPNVEQELQKHKQIAQATFKQNEEINIRLSSKDLRALQTRAINEGIPYQALVSSILHKFINGQLVENQ